VRSLDGMKSGSFGILQFIVSFEVSCFGFLTDEICERLMKGI